jgi:hypothetical protein
MIDRYTKAILTVIAACLVLLVLRSHPMVPANAQSGPMHIVIDGSSAQALPGNRGCLRKWLPIIAIFRALRSRTALRNSNVRFGSKADVGLALVDVRFTPKSGHC